MDKAFVIFNPAARGEKSRRAQRFLAGRSNAILLPTKAPGHAQQLAAQAVADGARLIVAAGGDGTINEVVNGMTGSAAALGVLPLGTANVFARELQIPLRVPAAWAVIEAGRRRTIDLGCAESAGQRRVFAQLAGVGFDAAAVERASWVLKKKFGPASYLWAGLQVIANPPAAVEVSLDGNAVVARGAAALIGNGQRYGGPFQLFPQARLDDGLLDVCVFEKGCYLDVMRYTQAVIRRTHTRLKDVRYFQTDRLECRAVAPAPFEVDGESAGRTPVSFSVLPAALRIIAP
jgi:YegS/Rv2252/BmrU family lipid kinase